MQIIKEKYLKTYGYNPTDEEIRKLYFSGSLYFNEDLFLTDEEENEIIKYFDLKVTDVKIYL